ncbi:MAG: hypothetical protein IJE26_03620 [Oscillospiraceae bacterium]|nr:hypothetical protein [Oscillospiraceae bacterium]
MTKRVLALSLALALALSLFAVPASAADATGVIDVSDGDVTVTATGYTVGESSFEYDGDITLTGEAAGRSITFDKAGKRKVTLDALRLTGFTAGEGDSVSGLFLAESQLSITLKGENLIEAHQDQSNAPAVTMDDESSIDFTGSGSVTLHGGSNYWGGSAAVSGGTLRILGGSVTLTGGSFHPDSAENNEGSSTGPGKAFEGKLLAVGEGAGLIMAKDSIWDVDAIENKGSITDLGAKLSVADTEHSHNNDGEPGYVSDADNHTPFTPCKGCPIGYRVMGETAEHDLSSGQCVCGLVCPHSAIAEDAKCAACQTALEASVTAGGVTRGYATLEEAIAAGNGAVVTLLKDAALESSCALPASLTLELGGHSIGGASLENSDKLTVSGSGSISSIVLKSLSRTDLSGFTGEELELQVAEDINSSAITCPVTHGLELNGSHLSEQTNLTPGSTLKLKRLHSHSWAAANEDGSESIDIRCEGTGLGSCAYSGGSVTLTGPAAPTYDGGEKAASASVSGLPESFLTENAPVIAYFEGETPLDSAPVNAGSYTAELTLLGVKARLDFTVAPMAVTVRAKDQSVPYGGSLSQSTELVECSVPLASVSLTAQGTAIVPSEAKVAQGYLQKNYSFSYENGLLSTAKVPADPALPALSASLGQFLRDVSIPAPADGSWAWKNPDQSVGEAGTKTFPAIFTPSDTEHYETVERELSVTVGKAVPSFTTVPAAQTPSYNGAPQPLVSPGTSAHGTVLYSLREADGYSAAIPTGTAVGNYTVWYYIQGSGSYGDSEKVSVPVTIAPRNISSASVTVTSTHSYTGAAQTPTVTVTLQGATLTAGQDYEVSPGQSVNAGASAFTVSGKGSYTGTVSGSFNIQARAVTPTAQLAYTQVGYTGQANSPAVTLKDGDAVIPAGEYTVTYAYNINAGTGRVYVNDVAGGNYSFGPLAPTFEILPTTITITADNKSATVGQNAPALTYKVEGLVGSDKLAREPIVSYVTKPDMSKTGTTLIRPSGAVAPNGNYGILYVDGKLTVSARSGGSTGGGSTGGGSYGGGSSGGNVQVTVDMSGIKLQNKVYDGKPLSFTGEASARYYYGDFTYTWYTANGYKLAEAPSDAGSYTLRATVNRSGYSGYASKNVTIQKAQITVTADSISAAPGDKAPEPGYSIKGLALGDKLKSEPSIAYDSQPDMAKTGETKISVSGGEVPDSKNYEKTIRYISGTLTVKEPGAQPTPVPSPEAVRDSLVKLEINQGQENRELAKKLPKVKDQAFYDLKLLESENGGLDWTENDEQFPQGGVPVLSKFLKVLVRNIITIHKNYIHFLFC